MKQINNRNPIFYKSIDEMDKPISELINELRNEIARTRGKLHDIKMSYGWKERIEVYEGGLTCMISAMSNFQDELIKFENRQNNKEKIILNHINMKEQEASLTKLCCFVTGEGFCPYELDKGECGADFICINQIHCKI